MGPSGHFYSHMNPVWSLLIVGTGFVPWVELPVQRRLCPVFREWCRVTRHPRVFRRLRGCQRTPENWGITLDFCWNNVFLSLSICVATWLFFTLLSSVS